MGLAEAQAAFMVCVNRIGVSGRCHSRRNGGWVAHAGGILALDPEGQELAAGQERNPVPERILVHLDRAQAVAKRREAACSLNFRRPELFRELSEESLAALYRARNAPPELGEGWEEEGK